MKLGYRLRQPRSSRGVSGDDPEGGARRGVPRRRLVTARPGRPGKSPARHYELAARSSLHGSGGNAGDGSAAPGEKSPRWSAERRASRVISAFTRVLTRYGTQGASQAPGTPRYGVPHGCSAEHPNVSRRSAHPSIRGERSKVANPGRKIAPRERDGLFDIVR
jgi:hypothetical protein